MIVLIQNQSEAIPRNNKYNNNSNNTKSIMKKKKKKKIFTMGNTICSCSWSLFFILATN